jgi:hypothetical protein
LLGFFFFFSVLAGTSSGHLLKWDMARYWTAGYWTQSSESSTDPRLPSQREAVLNGSISRLLLVDGGLLIAGRDSLARVSLPQLQVGARLQVSPQQHSFNALCKDDTLGRVLCGVEDGSVLSVDSGSLESEVFFEAGEGQAAVLDLVAGVSAVFVACAKGFVSAVDRETRSVLWRINMRTSSTSLDDNVVTGLRATVVRLDPSGKWLLCGAGSGAGSSEGGFLSIWHSETRDIVSVMPTRGCPSGASWHRGSIVCCGGENVVHEFDFNGRLLASSPIELTEAWDLACYQHVDDLVGGAIAIAGAGGHVLILPAVGRKAWTLKLEK